MVSRAGCKRSSGARISQLQEEAQAFDLVQANLQRKAVPVQTVDAPSFMDGGDGRYPRWTRRRLKSSATAISLGQG